MKILNSLNILEKPSCVSLGFFDGIHIGHRAVISNMVKKAKESGLNAVVFTFSESPKKVLGVANIEKIISNNQKENILNDMSVDILYNIDFSTIMNLSAREFVSKILIKTLKVEHVFCGFNYRFGKGGSSDTKELLKLCKEHGITTNIVMPVTFDNQVVSSSRIRNYLKDGKIDIANKLLKRPFSYQFPIMHGSMMGRKLGYPTINQELNDGIIIPKIGVYKSYVLIDGKRFDSVTNIGLSPTIGNRDKPNSETFILNYNGENLYGKNIEVFLLSYIRNEIKFESLDELKLQIEKDIYYNKIPPII